MHLYDHMFYRKTFVDVLYETCPDMRFTMKRFVANVSQENGISKTLLQLHVNVPLFVT